MAGKTSIEKRQVNFWNKVQKSETCWVWTGSLTPKGYGKFGDGFMQSPKLAHRVSWEWAHGAIPDGLLVLHKCDNSACVRPDHLFLGTNYDNVQDCVQKGRQSKGEKHGRAVLTLQQVHEIQASTLTVTELSKLYGVAHGHISQIRNGKKWKGQ